MELITDNNQIDIQPTHIPPATEYHYLLPRIEAWFETVCHGEEDMPKLGENGAAIAAM